MIKISDTKQMKYKKQKTKNEGKTSYSAKEKKNQRNMAYGPISNHSTVHTFPFHSLADYYFHVGIVAQ